MDIETLAWSLLSIWNEANADMRIASIKQLLSESVSYADPHLGKVIEGHAAFEEFIAHFRQMVPDVVVIPTSSAQEHNGFGKINFVIIRNESEFSRGTFFIERDTSGLVARIIGFANSGE
jgi:hypothetical protein